MKGFRYLSNVATLELNADKCVGCGRCLDVCPHQVFAIDEKKARLIAFDSCMECGACAMNCRASAIKVDAGVGCAAGLMMEWFRDRKLRGATAACC